jgi:hypothetical protein
LSLKGKNNCRLTAIQELVARALRRDALPAATRLLILEAMAQAPLDRLPAIWVAELRWCLDHSDLSIVRQAVADIRQGGVGDFDEAILRLAGDESRPAECRIEALAAAAPRIESLDDAHLQFLTRCLDKDQAPLLRLAAAGALGQMGLARGKSGLRDDQLAALTKFIATAGPLEMPRLLDVYERINNPTIAKELLAALAAAPALESLTPDALRRTVQGYPKEIGQAARPVLERLEPDAEKRKTRLAQLTPEVKGGDAARGKLVFFGKKAVCSTCHSVQSEGGQVGPDLSKIAAIRTESDLLESVIFPSLSIARGYEPYV